MDNFQIPHLGDWKCDETPSVFYTESVRAGYSRKINGRGWGQEETGLFQLIRDFKNASFALQQILNLNRHIPQQTKVDTSVFCQEYKSKYLQLIYNKITVFYNYSCMYSI